MDSLRLSQQTQVCIQLPVKSADYPTNLAHDCGIPKGLEPLWQDSKGQRPLVGSGAKPRLGVGAYLRSK